MNYKEKISVIIPNYNYGRFIGEAIESVLVQTLPPAEIVIVDDGSSDDSVKIIESFGNKVKLIKQVNGGVGRARNVGVENSSGDFFAFLDADDIWFSNKLSKQMTLFEDKTIGYVSCGLREFDLNGKTICHQIPQMNGWTTENMLLFDTLTAASGSTFIVSRKIFKQVGGFDENPDLHPSEDWDFARRVSQITRIVTIPEVLVHYRNHGGNGHLNIPRFENSMTLAFEKTFESAPPKLQKIKRKAYGNLHRVLAGSYFYANDYLKFLTHSVRSFEKSPENIFYFIKFPYRRIKKIFDE